MKVIKLLYALSVYSRSNSRLDSLVKMAPKGYADFVYPPDLEIISKILSEEEIVYFPGCTIFPVISTTPIFSLNA